MFHVSYHTRSFYLFIFCLGPLAILPRDSQWSPDIMLGTLHPNMCTLCLPILEVSMCFRGGSPPTTPPTPPAHSGCLLVPVITFKTHFHRCETFYIYIYIFIYILPLLLLLLLVLPPRLKETETVSPNCQLPATPDAIFRIQM